MWKALSYAKKEVKFGICQSSTAAKIRVDVLCVNNQQEASGIVVIIRNGMTRNKLLFGS